MLFVEKSKIAGKILQKMYNLSFFFIVFIAIWFSSNISMSVSPETQIAIDEVSQLIAEKYIDPNISQSELDKGALDGMLNALDPFSTYYDNEELQNFNNNTDGRFCGIGTEMVLDKDSGCAMITSVMPNTPASIAGVVIGDIITHINDVSVVGMKLNTIAKLIRGEAGTNVRITFYRSQTKETFTRLLTRKKIDIKDVESRMFNNNYAYLKINYFTQRTYNDFVDELSKVMQKYEVKGMIIDLRNNPGGLLDSAVDIANLFLKDGQIITSLKTRDNDKVSEYIARNTTDIFKGIKIALLVNKASASASEVLAGCLQDYSVAKLVGETTFGKALVQQVFKLQHTEGAVKLTTGMYYTPKDRKINGVGIKPDILVHESKNNKYDAILQAGLKYLRTAK